MSGEALHANVIHGKFPAPEFIEQMNFLGPDFSINSLIRNLKERSLFKEARGVIQSYSSSLEVRQAQRRTYENVYFSACCQKDEDKFSEIAHYRLLVDDSQPLTQELAKVEISPNALQVVYDPIWRIMDETVGDRYSPSEIRDEAIQAVYKGLYSSVIAQFMVKRHVMNISGEIQAGVALPFREKLGALYEQKFGQDGIDDMAARLDRLAMSLGGAVLMRHIAGNVGPIIDQQTLSGVVQVGNALRMYALGLSRQSPADQQEATFSLAHALRGPQETAKFINAWFE